MTNPFAIAAVLVMVVGLGSSVVVLKQTVDDDRERLRQLSVMLAQAQAERQRLEAEHAFHRRPAYLATYAEALGMVPVLSANLTTAGELPERPSGADDEHYIGLVELVSGTRVALRRRPVVPGFATVLAGAPPGQVTIPEVPGLDVVPAPIPADTDLVAQGRSTLPASASAVVGVPSPTPAVATIEAPATSPSAAAAGGAIAAALAASVQAVEPVAPSVERSVANGGLR